jgi:hypothetical protein
MSVRTPAALPSLASSCREGEASSMSILVKDYFSAQRIFAPLRGYNSKSFQMDAGTQIARAFRSSEGARPLELDQRPLKRCTHCTCTTPLRQNVAANQKASPSTLQQRDLQFSEEHAAVAHRLCRLRFKHYKDVYHCSSILLALMQRSSR